MFKSIIASLALLLIATSPVCAVDAQPPFAVGQMWTVKDSGMKVVIGRIDSFAGGKTAIHVTVFGVPCPDGMGCQTTNVGHAPFDEQALMKSIDKLVATDAQPADQFEQGYADWKKAEGGIFTVTVQELPKLLFQAITKGKREETH